MPKKQFLKKILFSFNKSIFAGDIRLHISIITVDLILLTGTNSKNNLQK